MFPMPVPMIDSWRWVQCLSFERCLIVALDHLVTTQLHPCALLGYFILFVCLFVHPFCRSQFRLPASETLDGYCECSMWNPSSKSIIMGKMYCSESYICFSSKVCMQVVIVLSKSWQLESVWGCIEFCKSGLAVAYDHTRSLKLSSVGPA